MAEEEAPQQAQLSLCVPQHFESTAAHIPSYFLADGFSDATRYTLCVDLLTSRAVGLQGSRADSNGHPGASIRFLSVLAGLLRERDHGARHTRPTVLRLPQRQSYRTGDVNV